jgi:hypothetical protein
MVGELYKAEEPDEVVVFVVMEVSRKAAEGVLVAGDKSVLVIDEKPVAEVVHLFGCINKGVLRS